jgi:pimeloyl-ACP methyl ester carboxylesterase
VTGATGGRPLDVLDVLATQEVEVTDGFRHVELFTMTGLLTMLWHGDQRAERVVLMCGGAMGGLLGPADGLFHDLGVAFAAEGIGAIRVGYRRPNDLTACTVDVAAAADLVLRATGDRARFVTVGHSFGGAVAQRAPLAIPEAVVGVDGLSTQSAGWEDAAGLDGRPLLLLHGAADELLPALCSEVAASLAGGGEVVVLPGAGHLLREAGDEVRTRLREWIPEVLAG